MKNMADNIGKPNKNKYFVGNKKLKNVKMYEEFGNEAPVNEGESRFGQELESNFFNLNIMHMLMDEGYLAPDGRMKEGVTADDMNSFLTDQLGEGTKDFFDGDDSVEAWVLDTLDELHKFAAKYKDEFVR